LQSKIQKTCELAAEAPEKARTKQKDTCTYNTKVRAGTVKEGDRVLVKIIAFDSKRKLADRWEQKPYTVIEQPNGEIPVFTVRRENGESRIPALRSHHLLPVGLLHDTSSKEIKK
jgi:hypothetical protein